MCLTEGAAYLLKAKVTLAAEFSFHFMCPAFYHDKMSAHQVQLLSKGLEVPIQSFQMEG